MKKKGKTCVNTRFSDQQLKQSLTALTLRDEEGWRVGVNRKVNTEAVLWLGIMVLT